MNDIIKEIQELKKQKKAGIGGTGGQSKFLVKEGQIQVNGQVVTAPGFTLHPNDKFGLLKGETWVVQQ